MATTEEKPKRKYNKRSVIKSAAEIEEEKKRNQESTDLENEQNNEVEAPTTKDTIQFKKNVSTTPVTANVKKDFSPFKGAVIEKDYAKGTPETSTTDEAAQEEQQEQTQQPNTNGGGEAQPTATVIEEPTFENLDEQIYDDGGDGSGEIDDGGDGIGEIVEMSDKEKRQAVETTVDILLTKYQEYRPKLYIMFGYPKRKIKKLQQSGELDLSLYFENPENPALRIGMTEALDRIYDSLVEGVQVTDEWVQGIRPLLIMEFMKYDIKVSPLMMIMFMIIEDNIKAVTATVQVNKQINETLVIFKELTAKHKFKTRPTQTSAPIVVPTESKKEAPKTTEKETAKKEEVKDISTIDVGDLKE